MAIDRIPRLTPAELTPEAVKDRLKRGEESLAGKNLQASLDILLPLAAAGNAEAQYRAAVVYDKDASEALITGAGQLGTIEDNFHAATKWYEKAAAQGNLMAQTNLGNHYCWGMGGARMGGVDAEKGMKWLMAAARQGVAPAMLSLGANYQQGICTAASAQEAVKWYTAAAEHGDIWARHNLGIMYASGQGVAIDHVQAYIWFELAGHDEDGEMREKLAPHEREEAARKIAAWRARFGGKP